MLCLSTQKNEFFFFFLLVTLKRKNTIFLSLSLPTLYIVLLYYQNLIVFLPRITSLSLSLSLFLLLVVSVLIASPSPSVSISFPLGLDIEEKTGFLFTFVYKMQRSWGFSCWLLCCFLFINRRNRALPFFLFFSFKKSLNFCLYLKNKSLDLFLDCSRKIKSCFKILWISWDFIFFNVYILFYANPEI